MKLGFVSAILADQTLEEVTAFAAANGFDCVELMCWPPGKAERRYAGVTHIDVTALGPDEAARIQQLMKSAGVEISGLGYYPNPLAPDPREAEAAVIHLRRVIDAARLLGVDTVTTFAGRDWTRSIDDNWARFLEVFRLLVAYAGEQGVRIAIENCPMLFTKDEWPGGTHGLPEAAARVRRPHLPRACQGCAAGPGAPRRRGNPGHPAQLSHAEAPGAGRGELGAFLLRSHRDRLPGSGLHRGRGPRSLALRQASLQQSARFLRQFAPFGGAQ